MSHQPRSILFYAWIGLAAQFALVIGVFVFVLVGAGYQRAAITALHDRVQRMQLANLTLQGRFLGAERALRGYQATGQDRFLQSYFTDQDTFALVLNQMRAMAWPAVAGGVTAQGHTAGVSFVHGDWAAEARPGTPRATRDYTVASTVADSYLGQNSALQDKLAAESSALAAQAERPLGIGLPGTVVVLAVGLMLPGTALLIGLRWASGPLSRITQMIRRRIAGDFSARIMPGGPANITDLAISLNSLADESDRMRLAEAERSRLLVLLRQVSTRIREHLHADAVISEAVSAIRDHLGADFVWVGLVEGSEVRLGAADQSHRDAAGSLVEVVPSGSADWMRQMYRGKSSYRVRDLRAPEAGEIPAGIRQILDAAGGGSVLLTAFGAGPEPMGAIALLRGDQARPWTEAEMQALEYVAEDVGRGLEHARVYEAEERLVSELQSVDQAKNSFIAASSHDVRTPLTSILGNLEMLADGEAGPMPAQQARMLDAVRRNALRLQTLIEDMLTISKIDLGAFTSDLKPTDLASVVPGAAEIIRPAAAEAGLIFTVDCPDAGLIIDGDPEQLDRVLINLLSNAVKYTPRGGSVTLAAAREDGCAVLTVADTGMGVPQAEQKSLFTRFFRASNAVERAIPGSGLGLSIVGSVVANHNGKVELTSAEGTGTTVTVRIPLLEGREPALPGMRRPVPLPRRQPGQRP